MNTVAQRDYAVTGSKRCSSRSPVGTWTSPRPLLHHTRRQAHEPARIRARENELRVSFMLVKRLAKHRKADGRFMRSVQRFNGTQSLLAGSELDEVVGFV